MSTHLLLFWDHYEKLKGDDWEIMSSFTTDERDPDYWVEGDNNPSEDKRNQKKPDSSDEPKCSKSEEDKSE